jgi:SAM-dependent methyltransferase
MSGASFGQAYAGVYDWLYADKDYAAECDLLEELFRRYRRGAIHTILDLGCGTGGHAFPLAERGCTVVGVDRSQGMIARAEQKLAALARGSGSEHLAFLQADLRNLDLKRHFDAVLMMFAVLGYQTTDQEVSAALRSARRHLDPGGLLVFDVWYGPAVLSQQPTDRLKVLETPHGRLQRSATPTLETQGHLCRVHYRVSVWAKEAAAEDFEEEHLVRYFFRDELERFLAAAHLELVHLCPMGEPDAEPSQQSWNVLACARAV